MNERKIRVVNGQELRCGFTTGSCAAAAASAAAEMLLSREKIEQTEITLPGGEAVMFDIEDAEILDLSAKCSVIKDGGDDPDVTTGLRITAEVSFTGRPQILHDFAVISLSDLLTPWEAIAKRLRLAAEGDFVICIYNPKSRKRVRHLDKAVDIISCFRDSDTPCGYVRNIGRDGERGIVCTLEELKDNNEIDMFTTVYIGNSSTKVIRGKLVTPRGYREI